MRRKKTTIKDENKNGKRSRSQKYRRIAEKIRARKMSVFDKQTGEYLLLSEGEEMVRCYDFDTFEEHEYHFVTSLGRVISLKGTRPHFLKLVAGANGYLKFGSGEYVHRTVWFSFAYNAIKNKREMPSKYGLPENRNRAFANLSTIAQKSDIYEVHHKDGDPQNNRLENLECIYIGSHSMLHTFEKLHGETEDETVEKRMDFVHNRKDITKPSIILPEEDLSVSELSSENICELQNSIVLKAWIITEWISQKYGAEYFHEDRICVIFDGSMMHCFDIREGKPTKRREIPVPMPEPDILFFLPSNKFTINNLKIG